MKAPKVYFTDVGLLCYLLGIKEYQQVATHPLMGSIFENMIVIEMLKARLNGGNDGDLYYMRTSHGVEIDIVAENAGKLDLTEVKAGETFHDEMADNLRSMARLLPNEVGNLAVIYAGKGASASGGIPVISFETMGRKVR